MSWYNGLFGFTDNVFNDRKLFTSLDDILSRTVEWANDTESKIRGIY